MSIGNSVAVGRCVRSLLAAVGLACGLGSLAVLPATASGQTTPTVQSSASSQLDKAADLLAANKVVAAKSLLSNLTSRGTILTDAEQQRAFKLLANANRRVKSLSPVEVSLQTAEDCLSRGDYLVLEQHANAVIASPKATNEQTAQARALLVQATDAKIALAGSVGATLDAIHADFEAGRTSQAKASLDALNRTGVAMTDDQAQLVTTMQAQIIDMEQANRAAPGMMQPGVIKPRNPAPAPAPAQPAAEQPIQPPPAQPVIEPPPAAAPPAQPVNDVIQTARAMDAQSILAEADVAYERALYNDAIKKYQLLLGSYAADLTGEQRARVDSRLAEAKVRIGQNVGPEGQVLESYLQKNTIKKQEALAQYTNNLEQARMALAGGDPSTASEKAATARLNVTSAKEFFTTAEVEGYEKQVDDLVTQIDLRRREIDKAEKEAQAKGMQDAANRQAAESALSKDRKISEAIQRVRALQSEMKYEEALQVCDQILFLDPINPTGLLLHDVISDILIYKTSAGIESRRVKSYAIQSNDSMEAMVVPHSMLAYPADWPNISYKRGEPTAFQESEENRNAYNLLSQKKVPVDFQDNSFESVVGFINAVTNLNIDTDWDKLAEAGIDKSTTVSLKLTNVPVRTVLERVLEKVSKDSSNGAAYAINDGVLMISTREAINKTKSLQIYDIKDLLIEVPDYTNAPEFDLQSVLQNSGQGSSQSPFRDNGDEEPENRRSLEDRTNELIEIITTNVDSQGWQENGGDVGFIQQLQGSLIITNTPANHRAINGLLNKLREIRAMQINVETRFLLVRTDFFEQIGFDLDVYFNGDNNQVRAARAAIPNGSVQPSDFFDFAQGGLQRRVFGAPTDANGDGTQDPQVGIATPLPSPLSVIGAGQNSLGLTEAGAGGSFAQTILAAAPAIGIAGQFMDDIQVDFLIKATQADRRTVALTAPRLTFTNGQTSNIYVATQVAFVSDLTPVVSESAVGFDPTLNTVNEGVRLLVEGTISADRRYVTMNVDASVAKIDGFRNTAVSAVAGGGIVSSASTQSFIQLPTTTVTRVQTTVTVPDQGTILLGGQRIVTEQDVESGVPVLSKIPIINRFFSNRIQVKEESTLLILIKPTILIQNEEEERFFPGLAESVKFGG